MSVVVQSLEKLQGQNPSGIVEVYMLPLNSIDNFESLSIKDNARIYYLWLGSSEAGYSDRINQSENGAFLSYQLDITVAGDCAYLESICRHKHILVFRDYLGNMFRVGSKESPFSCETQARNSSALDYRLRFSANGSIHFSVYATTPESTGMINLTPEEGQKTPGIINSTVFFAHQVISLPKLDGNGEMSGNPAILDSAKGWHIQCAELEAGYEYTIKRDENGYYYEQEISIDWPGMNDLEHFNRYKNAYFIVFTEDFTGIQRCFGTLDQPLKAAVRTNVAGGRDRNITFSGLTSRRPAIFTGQFETGTRPDPEPIETGMIDFLEDDFNDEDFL
jgi:hypothetical protein